MRIRKRLVVCFAALLAGIGFAIPATVSAASIPVTCGIQSGGVNNGNPAPIVDVRLGHHTEDGGFDRFVLEFNSSTIPPWEAIPKSSAVFYPPNGGTIKLQGNAGILLKLFAGTFPAWKGPKDFKTAFPQLKEAYELEDFEGYVQWGLGLQNQSCKRIMQLSGPNTHTRLVIDVPI
jgi:hypothetical protein